MSSGILTKREIASLMLMRVSKEPSRALPRQAYMDPARSVLFENERKQRRIEKQKREG